MKANMGGADRAIRLGVAILLVVVFFTKEMEGIPGMGILWAAALLTLTSMVRTCPLYALFGYDTRHHRAEGGG